MTISKGMIQRQVSINFLGDFDRQKKKKKHDFKLNEGNKDGEDKIEREMTNRQPGVDLAIMEEGGEEVYLRDVIGNEVGEETTFGDIHEKVEKLGARWNKEHLGVHP